MKKNINKNQAMVIINNILFIDNNIENKFLKYYYKRYKVPNIK